MLTVFCFIFYCQIKSIKNGIVLLTNHFKSKHEWKQKHDVKAKGIKCINLNNASFKTKFIRNKRISCFGKEQRKISETMKNNEKDVKENEQDSVVTLPGKMISSSRTLGMDRLIHCFISIL